MPVVSTLLAALAPSVWGTTYLVTSELLPSGHPYFAGLVRALPAGLIAVLITRTLPSGAWWWKAALLGVLNIGLFFPLLFAAADRLPGGVAATLLAAQPLAVALLAIPILAERPSAWRLWWAIAGAVGVALVVLRAEAMFDAVGMAAGIGGALAMASGVTLAKRWGRPDNVSATTLAGWQLTAGGLFLLPFALAVDGVPHSLDPPGIAGYAWLGVAGGLMAYALWFRAIGQLPVTSVAVLGLLSPLVAAALGAIVLGQTLDATQLIGFVLALTALVAGQLDPRRATTESPTTNEREHPR